MSETPLYVILDSNIWIKELALQTIKASAVRYYLKQNGAKLIVPEVVRLEVEHHLRERMFGCRNAIERAHRDLLYLMGRQRKIILPTDEEIEATVPTLIDDTGVDTLNPPLTLELANSSLARIRAKRPPSHNKEQFADGVIWEHCAELVHDATIFLVTNDHAFFKGNDAKTGQLSPDLLKEVSDCDNRIEIYPDLNELMKSIRTDIDLDHDELISEARRLAESDIVAFLNDHQFSLGPAEVIECNAFITEKPDELYLHVTVAWHPLIDETLTGRSDGKLTVVVEGKFMSNGSFSEKHLNKVSIDYTDEHETTIHRGTVYARASPVTIGGPGLEKHTHLINPHQP